MDLMIFIGAVTVGFAFGLSCRRNNIRVLPNYEEWDMGVFGKRRYFEKQKQLKEQKLKVMNN
jgi:hypothetical protein